MACRLNLLQLSLTNPHHPVPPMTTDRHTRRAAAIVVATGVFWGFSWLPLRTPGALFAALALAPFLSPPPAALTAPLSATTVALATGGLWWALSIASLMWATVRLDPIRVGILLMSQVRVGAASAAVFAGELLDRPDLIGGALVLCVGILEV
jgi:hypothetical protein